jgi:plasmid stabilization system protein ParE
VTRRVEFRPQAERDLDRLDNFLLKMSYLAAQRRMRGLRAEIASLAENPHRGQQRDRRRYQLYLRYARSTYVVRYHLTAESVTITRISHGKEKRRR